MKLAAVLVTILTMAYATPAENIVFPADAGVIDVKAKYGAKGDGVSDDTAAIQKAVDEIKGIPDTLYFPNGTDLINDSVGTFNGKAHSKDRLRPARQRQSLSGCGNAAPSNPNVAG